MASRRDSKGYALLKGESQRSDGRYQYRYEDVDGKRRTVYATTLKELRKKEKDIELKTLMGVNTTRDSKTVSDMFNDYISTKLNIRASTRQVYERSFKKHVQNRIGKKKISDIDGLTMKKFYTDIFKNSGLKTSTISTIHMFLSPIFEIAYADSYIQRNYEREAWKYMIGNRTTVKTKRNALDVETQKSLIKFITDEARRTDPSFRRIAEMLEMLLHTGMRIGELLALKWDDCNFDEGVIRVDESTHYLSGVGHYIGETKTNSSVRLIPMTSRSKEILLRIRSADKSASDDMTVFRGRTNKPLCSKTVEEWVKYIRDEYNKFETEEAEKEKRAPLLIKQLTPHIFRHTYCSRLCESDVNIKTIQNLMGHSSITTTMDIYTQVSFSKMKKEIENLDQKGLF